MQTWAQLSEIAQTQTGRRVVGTSGGLYTFSETEIRLPLGSVEGLVHDLCHWVVANDEERKMPNMGLSQDWNHPGYDRMVKCEEMAWSLENYLFGDPRVEVMAAMLTPEARVSGGGINISSHTHDAWMNSRLSWDEFTGAAPISKESKRRQAAQKARDVMLEEEEKRKAPSLSVAESAEVVAHGVTQAALAEMERAREKVIGSQGQLRPDGNENLRREALDKAERSGLPVRQIQKLIREWWLEQYVTPDQSDELASTWKLLRRK